MPYMRIVPYNKKRGALCRRFSAGGQLFVEGRWYEMDRRAAELLGKETQDTGCPVFEILDSKKEWRATVRRELAAMFGGPAAVAMADQIASAPPRASRSPKVAGQKIPSKFEGIKAGEITDAEIASTLTVEAPPETSSQPPAKSPRKRRPRPRAVRKAPPKRSEPGKR